MMRDWCNSDWCEVITLDSDETDWCNSDWYGVITLEAMRQTGATQIGVE